MGELAIRRNRTFAAAKPPTAVRTEKPAAGSPKTSAGDIVSETLRQKFGGVGLAEAKESRRTLQTGEAALSEVNDCLSQMAKLAEEAAGGGNREELQKALDALVRQVDRMLSSASAGGPALFLDEEGTAGVDALLTLLSSGVKTESLPDWLVDGASSSMGADEILAMLGVDRNASGAELLQAIINAPGSSAANKLAALYLGAIIIKGSPLAPVTPEEALRGLEELMAKVESGVPLDEAIRSLTNGAFTGVGDFQTQFAGGTLPGLEDFLTNLLTGDAILLDASLLDLTLLLSFGGPEDGLLAGLLDLLQADASLLPDLAANPEALADNGAAPKTVQQFGDAQAAGRDLSGVSVQDGGGASGEMTVSGASHVAVRSPAALALRLTGSGVVLLRSPEGASVAADSPAAKLFVLGRTVLQNLSLARDASLTLGGGGLVRLTNLRGEAGSVLHLTAGTAAVLENPKGETAETLPAVVVHGPVSFAAQNVEVRDASGRALQPFDVVWKALLPGWSRISSVEIDGRQAKMALLQGEPARLWLDKGDRGHPISLVFRGWDSKGNPATRYACLRWNQQWMGFEEMEMYPNPFRVTGGEMGRDWVYEEETRTLRILSPSVTAISGGAGTGADKSPYWGRLAFADGIGRTGLTLCGVTCRSEYGSGFGLGAGNDVILFLENGTENVFEGAPGFAGIALGEDTALCIDCPDSGGGRIPAGILKATGGRGGAGIGRDEGDSGSQTCRILIRAGVIVAKAGKGGAGIGAGKGYAVGLIEINGGEIEASGRDGGAGIGGGLNAAAGDLLLRGGRITATAANHAAAIGAGLRGSCGEIRISGSARILKALGGNPGADIGGCLFGDCGGVFVSGAADVGRAKLWTPKQEETTEPVTLPQFRLSARSMGLDRLNLHTPEDVRRARQVLETDRQWVSQVQAAYGALYSRLEHNGQTRRERAEASGLLRSTAAAGAVFDLVRQTICQPSAQAIRSHGGQKTDSIQQLLE